VSAGNRGGGDGECRRGGFKRSRGFSEIELGGVGFAYKEKMFGFEKDFVKCEVKSKRFW